MSRAVFCVLCHARLCFVTHAASYVFAASTTIIAVVQQQHAGHCLLNPADGVFYCPVNT
jgi:hypothetical protein